MIGVRIHSITIRVNSGTGCTAHVLGERLDGYGELLQLAFNPGQQIKSDQDRKADLSQHGPPIHNLPSLSLAVWAKNRELGAALEALRSPVYFHHT